MAGDYPLTMTNQDGTAAEVLYDASVYRDAGGNVLGVFAARDVTKRVHAQRDTANRQGRQQERLVELERFQRLTVGCGLKMIELEKETEMLRRERSQRKRRRPLPTFTASPRWRRRSCLVFVF
jgi:hypothetical protein